VSDGYAFKGEDGNMERLWAFVVIGGPIIFAIGLLWAMTHNRMSRRQKEESDAGTRRFRREEAQDNLRE
jgi:hypothetical protein